jgi:rhodanese-related sulfurtransferase
MKKSHDSLRVRVFWVLILFVFGAAPSGWAGKAPGLPVEPAAGTISPALATSVAAALAGLKEKSIHLVDIRSKTDFEQFHIPGSLNISLYAIRTKAYLKNKPIVLVNEGFALVEPAEGCKALNRAGFRATLLAGGLMSWKARGGCLAGDPFAMTQLNRVIPMHYFLEAGNGHHLLVDASEAPDQHAMPVFDDALAVDLSDNAKAFSQIKEIFQADPADPFRTIVIYTEDGRKDDYLQRCLVRAGINEFFIIQGGRRACEQQFHNLQMAGRPLKDRLYRSGGCTRCAAQ